MHDRTVRRHVGLRPDGALDRAFVAAYAVALAGNLLVSLLTYVYVGPGVGGVREANPVTAAVIGWVGLEGMVAIRTAVLIGGYRVYARVRARTGLSALVVAFAWLGAGIQLANLAADLRVVALAGPPPTPALLAGGAVVAPALLAGVVLRPPGGGYAVDGP